MKIALITAATLLAAALPAQALLIQNASALAAPAQHIDFESFDSLLTSGPVAVAAQVTFTGDALSELGATHRDLRDNGIWGDNGNHFAASGFIGELRFTFSNLSKGAGAFVNHFALDGLPGLAVVVSAYGDNNQIIETHTLTIDTALASQNQGLFLGINRANADIRSLSFKGVGVVVDNFSYTTPVPEPESAALMLAGLLGLGLLVRRRR